MPAVATTRAVAPFRALFNHTAHAVQSNHFLSAPHSSSFSTAAAAAPFPLWSKRPATPAAANRSIITTAAAVAGKGDYVEVHYVGTLDDSSEFDSSRAEDRDPLSFTIGAGRVVPGFEVIATGMAVGDRRSQRIDPDLAYGEWSEGMTAKVPLGSAPEGLSLGDTVSLQNGMQATVTEVTDEFVNIDANHRLAGKALTFDVELLRLCKGENMQMATFGAGCFWSVELVFQRVPGVISTAVGYSQGEKADVTYEEVCSGTTGFNEVVQITYDSSETTYETLLDVFFKKHDPTTLNRQGNDVGEQYRSGIYYHTEEQRKSAEAAVAKMNEKLSGQVVSELEPVRNFQAAEEYHQQYLAKGGRFNRPQSARKGCDDPIRCYG